jgi:hypothetical protein
LLVDIVEEESHPEGRTRRNGIGVNLMCSVITRLVVRPVYSSVDIEAKDLIEANKVQTCFKEISSGIIRVYSSLMDRPLKPTSWRAIGFDLQSSRV